MFVTPGNGQGNGTILITGAIGDLGTTHGFRVHGQAFAYATLRHGKIEFNLTKVAAKANSASPKIDAATCSAAISVSAPVSVVGGTGLYKGVSGTVNLTESIGYIGATYTTGSKKGQCNMSNSAPTVGQVASVHGTGTVRF